MIPGVVPDGMTISGDTLNDGGIFTGILPQHEECGPSPMTFEDFQQHGGKLGMRSVVERKCDYRMRSGYPCDRSQHLSSQECNGSAKNGNDFFHHRKERKIEINYFFVENFELVCDETVPTLISSS